MLLAIWASLAAVALGDGEFLFSRPEAEVFDFVYKTHRCPFLTCP